MLKPGFMLHTVIHIVVSNFTVNFSLAAPQSRSVRAGVKATRVVREAEGDNAPVVRPRSLRSLRTILAKARKETASTLRDVKFLKRQHADALHGSGSCRICLEVIEDEMGVSTRGRGNGGARVE